MSSDRDYYFIARAIDCPGLNDGAFVDRLQRDALPVWKELLGEGALANVRTFRKVGVIGLGAENTVDREWAFFCIAEIGEGVDAEEVADREVAGWKAAGLYDTPGIDILATELLMRRAGSGTALPQSSEQHDGKPAHFTTAVEYIYKLPGHEDAYRTFMHDVFGPVGQVMVQKGDAYSVTITERVKVFNRDLNLPDWNDIHILVGDFDDRENGFAAKAGEAVSTVLGEESDALSALQPAVKLRRKVLMSKNVEVAELCLGRI